MIFVKAKPNALRSGFVDARLCRTFLAYVYFEDEPDPLHRNELPEIKDEARWIAAKVTKSRNLDATVAS